jgi:hypothetical protein
VISGSNFPVSLAESAGQRDVVGLFPEDVTPVAMAAAELKRAAAKLKVLKVNRYYPDQVPHRAFPFRPAA